MPGTGRFDAWGQREEIADFVRRYAPAHVLMRVCFVDPAIFDDLAVLASPPTLPPAPTASDVEDYAASVLQRQTDLNALLCSVVSVVSHDSAIHLYECIDEGRNIDRLGVGLLPTEPTP